MDCSHLTVPQLKEKLRRSGLRVGGTKAELCARLAEHRRSKHKKQPSSVPRKVADPNESLFKFYGSMYYQKPGSTLAFQELQKYGLDKQFLNRFKTHQQLFDHIRFST